jgi:hypothetical protein
LSSTELDEIIVTARTVELIQLRFEGTMKLSEKSIVTTPSLFAFIYFKYGGLRLFLLLFSSLKSFSIWNFKLGDSITILNAMDVKLYSAYFETHSLRGNVYGFEEFV